MAQRDAQNEQSQLSASTIPNANPETSRVTLEEAIQNDLDMATAITQMQHCSLSPGSSPTSHNRTQHLNDLINSGQYWENRNPARVMHHRRTASANAVSTGHHTTIPTTFYSYTDLDQAILGPTSNSAVRTESPLSFSRLPRPQITTTTTATATATEPTTEDASPTSDTSSLPTPPPSTPTILQEAESLPLIPRFQHLLTHTKSLLQEHSYIVDPSTNTLLRAHKPRQTLTHKRLASSLSAAQTTSHTPQPASPTLEDLKIFSYLWTTTAELFDLILTSHAVLSLEAFGWGAYGLASGYIHPDPLSLNHKHKLYDALRCIPYLMGKSAEGDVQVGYYKDARMVKIGEKGRAYDLTSANRCVHVCAWLLVQGMKRGGWEGVEWGFGVEVCEGWLRHLGWV